MHNHRQEVLTLERKEDVLLAGKKVLDKGLCDKLVQSASLTIGHNVLITDETGCVLSSNDTLREGTLHEASVYVMETGLKAYHDSHAAKRLKGTMPGMTIPLFVDSTVIGTIGITGSPQEISRYALLIQQMSQVFLAFQIQQRSSAQMDYRKQSLLREIVAFGSRTLHPSAIYNNAYEIGVDLNTPRAAILIEVSTDNPGEHPIDDAASLRERIMNRLTRLFHQTHDFVCQQGDAEYVLFARISDNGSDSEIENVMRKCRQLADDLQTLGPRLHIGVGSPADSLETLHVSYKNASFAVRILKARLRKADCLFIGDVILEKLAINLPYDVCNEAEFDFFNNILQSKNSEEIMQIIEHWCRQRFNFVKTAAALHVHKNTLSYRFQRIRELHGLDLYDFDRVMALYLLIVRRKLA